MKITRFLATLCLAAVLGFAGTNTSLKENPNVSFDTDKWIGEWTKMWNSYDLDQVDRLFITDLRLTYLSSEKEGTLQGIEAVREHHRGFGFVEGGKDQPNKLWVENLVTTDLGDTASLLLTWLLKPCRARIFFYLQWEVTRCD